MVINGKLKFLTSMTTFGTVGIFVRFIPLSPVMIAFCRGVLILGSALYSELPSRKKQHFPQKTGGLFHLFYFLNFFVKKG